MAQKAVDRASAPLSIVETVECRLTPRDAVNPITRPVFQTRAWHPEPATKRTKPIPRTTSFPLFAHFIYQLPQAAFGDVEILCPLSRRIVRNCGSHLTNNLGDVIHVRHGHRMREVEDPAEPPDRLYSRLSGIFALPKNIIRDRCMYMLARSTSGPGSFSP